MSGSFVSSTGSNVAPPGAGAGTIGTGSTERVRACVIDPSAAAWSSNDRAA
jgi:hypothetical protein